MQNDKILVIRKNIKTSFLFVFKKISYVLYIFVSRIHLLGTQ